MIMGVRRKITMIAAAAGGAVVLVTGVTGVTAAGHQDVHHAVHDAAKTHGDPPFAINVTSSPYNAACNGSTDDTTAIQSALNAAPSSGARVQVPATSAGCRITGTLTIPRNVVLEGETPDTVLWFNSTGNGPAVRIGTTAGTTPVDQFGGGLKDIGIQGNSGSGAYPSQVGVQVSRASNVVIDDVTALNFGVGVQIDGGPTGDWSSEVNVVDSRVENAVVGYQTTDSGGTITDTHFVNDYAYGVSTSSGKGYDLKDLHSSSFEGNSVEHFQYGVYVSGSSRSSSFFGWRAESSGTANGTTAYVCTGTGVNDSFYAPYDADVATTTVQNLSSATCATK